MKTETKEYINIQTKEILDMKLVDKLKNNAMLKVNPHLFVEWDFEKNESYNIYDMKKGSDIEAWWICPKCESPYDRKIELRNRGQNCPFCAGKRVNHTNSLASQRPDLMKQWCKENDIVSPHDVTCGSHKKAWWHCEVFGDSYPMSINKKTSGRGCSICSGYYVTRKSSFGGQFPELAKEWHPTLNGKLTPYDVSYGSGKKVWWKCKHCHSDYPLTVDKKTAKDYNPHSCSVCSTGVSFGERALFEILRVSEIPFAREQSFQWSNKKRYDFFIPSFNTIVEVHGEQHYNGSFSRAGGRTLQEEQENDAYKKQLAKQNGIEHYIVIESMKYNLESIKTQMVSSGLLDILGMSPFDMDKIRDFSMNNLMSETWSLYNDGLSVKEITKKVPLHESTIKRYLKLGSSLNKCEYPKSKRVV